MSALTWVLAGIAVYWVALLLLRNRGWLPDYVGTQGPIITLHTIRGRPFLDRLSRPRRFWRAWSNVGIGVALVVMILSFGVLLLAAISAMRTPERTAVTEPQNVLVIPGVNEFLPLSVAPEIVAGMLVGLVVHEGAHGLLCRVEDIEIESMGLALVAIVPVGAFVEPDHESQERADRGGRTRMFAAGVTANFVVTIVAFALLFGPVVGSIAVAPGAAVGGAFPGSAADDAGIDRGDRVVGFEDEEITDNDDLDAALEASGEDTVTVTVDDGDDERQVDVERSLLVVGAPSDGPTDVDANTTITAVNGTPVRTEAEFESELRDRPIATLETDDGEHTIPVGAHVPVVAEDGPATQAGIPANATVVITHVDGERVISAGELTDVLDGTEPGQTVTVEAFVDGERETYEVELGEHPQGQGQMGITPQPGVTGLDVSDFGTETYPAGQYLTLLGGDGDDGGIALADSFLGRIFLALMLPIASIVNGWLPYNFAGFTGIVTNFYVVDGPLALLGSGVFLLANALFWTAWINLNLAFFNCIPAFPLDGGHILRTSTEAVVSRLPVSAGPELTKSVTITVGMTMLASLLLMVFGQGLLA